MAIDWKLIDKLTEKTPATVVTDQLTTVLGNIGKIEQQVIDISPSLTLLCM